uniref:Uncharacterized protein LOC111116195 n=1 Tax=Crassostrea virginica TaxID=6565 RepID=A0A8B8C7V4_CRAVI|nr:uncharacterized protein LOC111116195 [Crassostrea virginica]
MSPQKGRGDRIIQWQIVFLLTSGFVLNITAISTNNRILLGTLLAGSALATSVYGDKHFSEFELALLTTAALILIFPRPQSESAVNTCTAPGYTDDTVMGCYRLYTNIEPLTKEEAVKQCAGDGGRLVLIKSETEAKAFQKMLLENKVILSYMQGKRTSVGAPWTDESGNPLPYLASGIVNNNNPNSNALILVTNPEIKFMAVDAQYRVDADVLCQI